MLKLECEQISDLSAGAVFLATGGGCDPYVYELLTKSALETYGHVDLLDPSEIGDEWLIITLGAVGAPTVSLELLPSIHEPANTVRAFEQRFGRRVDAIVPFEIGGGNSLIPVIAAAELNLPVINGDGMGRAFPEAQMMTYPITGVLPTPAVALDYLGNITEFHCTDCEEFERAMRHCAMTSGGMITSAEHPMTGRLLKDAVVPQTMTFATRLGGILRKHRGTAHAMFPHLQRLFSDSIYGDIFHLYTGKVVDCTTRVIGGYDIGEATIAPFEGTAPPLKVNIKNEYLLAQLDGVTVASVPDLITIVDYETSTPINAERLRYGQRVTVFGIGCPEFYRSSHALKYVAPACFGFPMDYKPIETISRHHASGLWGN